VTGHYGPTVVRPGHRRPMLVAGTDVDLLSLSARLVRRAVNRSGLSREEIAQRSGVGPEWVDAVLDDHGQPKLPTLVALIDATGWSLRVEVANRRSGPERNGWNIGPWTARTFTPRLIGGVMVGRGWSPSELGCRCGLKPDRISTLTHNRYQTTLPMLCRILTGADFVVTLDLGPRTAPGHDISGIDISTVFVAADPTMAGISRSSSSGPVGDRCWGRRST
jgi:DNA-binding phage protein